MALSPSSQGASRARFQLRRGGERALGSFQLRSRARTGFARTSNTTVHEANDFWLGRPPQSRVVVFGSGLAARMILNNCYMPVSSRPQDHHLLVPRVPASDESTQAMARGQNSRGEAKKQAKKQEREKAAADKNYERRVGSAPRAKVAASRSGYRGLLIGAAVALLLFLVFKMPPVGDVPAADKAKAAAASTASLRERAAMPNSNPDSDAGSSAGAKGTSSKPAANARDEAAKARVEAKVAADKLAAEMAAVRAATRKAKADKAKADKEAATARIEAKAAEERARAEAKAAVDKVAAKKAAADKLAAEAEAAERQAAEKAAAAVRAQAEAVAAEEATAAAAAAQDKATDASPNTPAAASGVAATKEAKPKAAAPKKRGVWGQIKGAFGKKPKEEV